jgi:hypothetical protein
MVEFQVKDVGIRFEYLNRLREANYVKTAELSEYFENKMNLNKPKELERDKVTRKAGDKIKSTKTYLRKVCISLLYETTYKPIKMRKLKTNNGIFNYLRKTNKN